MQGGPALDGSNVCLWVGVSALGGSNICKEIKNNKTD